MEEKKSLSFIEQIIEEDLSKGYSKSELRFRFPPEPNGYLHIGHASAICLNFELGKSYQSPVNLRFDDTNPVKESEEYIESIKKDVAWLGYNWDKECYASDYFDTLYEWAIELIKKGKAYVEEDSAEEMSKKRGDITTSGTESPHRNRPIEESLDLFLRMKNGEFEEGTMVLRAKISMSSQNLIMRDPVLYRILHHDHIRTGDKWCIYPTYDWAHGQSDYIEGISHSLCTLEFRPHRDLYNWLLEQLENPLDKKIITKQREFARRNLSHTVVSKRKLLKLVEGDFVNGWDDPRMPTISGMKKRGYPPASIRKFTETIGIGKRENLIDYSLLEFCVREELNKSTPRVHVVNNPLKITITNLEDNFLEWIEVENDSEETSRDFENRKIPFTKNLYIEQEDFKEEANRKFFRLKLGGEVRLKNGYIIKAEKAIKDENGNITEVECTYDPLSKSGSGTPESKRKVKGTLHWVAADYAVPIQVNEYDRLFNHELPDGDKDKDFLEYFNPNSLKTYTAYAEPELSKANVGDAFQFQRIGYFRVDESSCENKLVFNKTVGLRDSWAKISLNK